MRRLGTAGERHRCRKAEESNAQQPRRQSISVVASIKMEKMEKIWQNLWRRKKKNLTGDMTGEEDKENANNTEQEVDQTQDLQPSSLTTTKTTGAKFR